MRKQVLIVILCTCLAGCAKAPEEVAKTFAQEMRKGKVTEAKKYTTEPSGRLLDLSNAAGFLPEINPDFRFELTSKTIDGNRALVGYRDGNTEFTLTLVKIDNVWKIDLESAHRQKQKEQELKENNEKMDFVRAKVIGVACRAYAAEHNGLYPADLKQLVPEYDDGKNLVSPLATDTDQPSYEYFGKNHTENSPVKLILKGRFTTSDGRRSLVYSDGNARLERDEK